MTCPLRMRGEPVSPRVQEPYLAEWGTATWAIGFRRTDADVA